MSVRTPVHKIVSCVIFPDNGRPPRRREMMRVQPYHDLGPVSLAGGYRRLVEPDIVGDIPDSGRPLARVPARAPRANPGPLGRERGIRGADAPVADDEYIRKRQRFRAVRVSSRPGYFEIRQHRMILQALGAAPEIIISHDEPDMPVVMYGHVTE